MRPELLTKRDVEPLPTLPTVPGPKRKRGNPLWGTPMLISSTPALATQFELRARQLHLTRNMYVSSRELYAWCDENKNRVYIPEWLLKEWGMTVHLSFTPLPDLLPPVGPR